MKHKQRWLYTNAQLQLLIKTLKDKGVKVDADLKGKNRKQLQGLYGSLYDKYKQHLDVKERLRCAPNKFYKNILKIGRGK